MKSAGLCVAAWCLAWATPAATAIDDRPAFEVASVKLTPGDAMGVAPVLKCENGRLTMRKLILSGIVSWALDIAPYDIVLPGWAEGAGRPAYDIDAKAADSVSRDQVKLMLQRLLAERFRFAAHHEMREGIHQVLRIAKGGAKLKEAAVIAPGTITVKADAANSRIIGTGASIAELLGRLNSTGVGGPIYDRTGLTGRYDFTLDYGKYVQESDPGHQLNALMAARLDAMRAELGLEVAEVKTAVDTLVVDHVERIPGGN